MPDSLAALSPFAPHWLERDGARMHYVDEGAGVPVLMLHGNPTWSYLHRHVIGRLDGACRRIAPDYPGFGRSDHPPGYGYTPEEHAGWVHTLVEHLGLERFVLVVHDWGGPIGLSVAVREPERVAGLVICNTWCWRPDWRLRAFSLLAGTRAARWPNLHGNVFPRFVIPLGIYRSERRTREVLRAYRAPFPTPESRVGTWVFARSLRASAAWLESIEERLARLRGVPVELVWGTKDPAFGWASHRDRWRAHFPDAHVELVEDAGHYVQEDRPERVVAAVRRVLERVG